MNPPNSATSLADMLGLPPSPRLKRLGLLEMAFAKEELRKDVRCRRTVTGALHKGIYYISRDQHHE
jgi:hypothetical protein